MQYRFTSNDCEMVEMNGWINCKSLLQILFFSQIVTQYLYNLTLLAVFLFNSLFAFVDINPLKVGWSSSEEWVWWPMGAIAKSTIVFLFLLYISVLYIFSVLIDLICWFFYFILERFLFLSGLYRKLNFIYSENVLSCRLRFIWWVLFWHKKTKLNCN